MAKKVIQDPLEELRRSLCATENATLFSKEVDPQKEVEQSCCNYLKSLGYKVSKNPINTNINKVEDLINYFYSLSEFYHGECLVLTSNKKRDLVMASSFVTQRAEALGCTKKSALHDCVVIMEGLFLNEGLLGLDRPVGLWVFGTDKCRWITDKVISILNDTSQKRDEERARAAAGRWSAEASKNYSGMDIEEIRKRRKLNG